MKSMQRRKFLQTASISSVGLLPLLPGNSKALLEHLDEPYSNRFKLSLNAYSFNAP